METGVFKPAFPLVSALGSTGSAADRSALFVGFTATMAERDFSCPCIITGITRRTDRPLSARTGNRGSFQRHGNWDSFGVAMGYAMKLPRRQFLHLASGAAAL